MGRKGEGWGGGGRGLWDVRRGFGWRGGVGVGVWVVRWCWGKAQSCRGGVELKSGAGCVARRLEKWRAVGMRSACCNVVQRAGYAADQQDKNGGRRTCFEEWLQPCGRARGRNSV